MKRTYNKDPEYRNMINSTRWQKLRAFTLSKHPLCEMCRREGYYVSATEVHHITPVESVPNEADKARLMFDPMNLMPLCSECHREIHRQLGKGSKTERMKRTKAKVENAIKTFFGGGDCDEDQPRGGDFLKGPGG